ncbi:hypothetical protein OPT61_g3143 [Boeremia exigua]|uniref:Uncharacterized protein n=1 Tax=Boeremia exigua TaxID=749465 RepID=A0ACC2IJ45_9PLEO|nr:hypothetical protein OPT61_g3143 [Boeremia exigua]
MVAHMTYGTSSPSCAETHAVASLRADYPLASLSQAQLLISSSLSRACVSRPCRVKCTGEEEAPMRSVCVVIPSRCGAHGLDNDFAAVDHVGAPLGRVELALCGAGHGDVERLVQVPGLEGGGGGAGARLVERAAGALAQLVFAAVDADDEDGVSA